jgi:3-dehydroquinate synthase
VALVQVPTSLLAQVDSSVGGKVGVDHPAGKNLIGSFHQPRAVFIDPTVLRTLPRPEFRNGLVEAVKIAAALDPDFFLWLERHARTLLPGNSGAMAALITRSVELKSQVVRTDERDLGVRQALNLGHTIGHALEVDSVFSLRHGFAVSIGMAAEARIARRLGLMGERDADRMLRLLQMLRLPTRIPRLRSRSRFYGALAADKKGDVSGTKFTLPAGIGVCALGVDVRRDTIEAVMDGRS